MTDTMIEATAVTKTFGGVTALDGVSVTVPRGTVLGLLGHNGAGKTTLVNILTTMFPPTSGSAKVAGFDVVGQGDEVRSRIGLTGQFASVDEQLSGTDNLVLIARLLGASRREPGSERTNCSTSSISPTRPNARPGPTRAACAGVSTWPRASSAGRT